MLFLADFPIFIGGTRRYSPVSSFWDFASTWDEETLFITFVWMNVEEEEEASVTLIRGLFVELVIVVVDESEEDCAGAGWMSLMGWRGGNDGNGDNVGNDGKDDNELEALKAGAMLITFEAEVWFAFIERSNTGPTDVLLALLFSEDVDAMADVCMDDDPIIIGVEEDISSGNVVINGNARDWGWFTTVLNAFAINGLLIAFLTTCAEVTLGLSAFFNLFLVFINFGGDRNLSDSLLSFASRDGFLSGCNNALFTWAIATK